MGGDDDGRATECRCRCRCRTSECAGEGVADNAGDAADDDGSVEVQSAKGIHGVRNMSKVQ